MDNEEFIASIKGRVEQLKIRANMDWYSKEALEEAFSILKETIHMYINEKPQYKEEMEEELAYIKSIEKKLT